MYNCEIINACTDSLLEGGLDQPTSKDIMQNETFDASKDVGVRVGV